MITIFLTLANVYLLLLYQYNGSSIVWYVQVCGVRSMVLLI